jgi:ubiquinone/menaquinone biosynthesis C-methylase UbiE
MDSDGAQVDEDARWNHNIHYHQRVLAAVPEGAQTALDVGTGNGLLAADLRQIVPAVTGIDADAEVLKSAREEDAGVTWNEGDFMTYPLVPGSFDVVASIATLHHLPDLGAALTKMADLTAPGGVVVNVGMARSSTPADAFYDAIGFVHSTMQKRRHQEWQHTAPAIWPPPLTYSEVRRIAQDTLPGMSWTRLTLWRYALVWHKSQ